MAQAQKAIRLGDWLLDRGVVTQNQLDLALREQKRKGWLLGEAFAQLGFVTQETLSQFLAQKTQTESVDLAAITIPPEMVKLVPEQLARRLVAVPVSREGDLLTVAISDPLNVTAFDALEQVTRLQVNLVAAPEGDIFLAIERLYASGQSIEDIIDELLKLGSDKLANTTVIIGGLIQNERHKTERKVPILGDIPILGYPFRGVFENKRRTELVIFITPTIVR